MTELEKINRRIELLLKQSDIFTLKKNKSFVGQLKKTYQSAYNDIDLEIARIYRKYGESVEYSDMLKLNKLKNLKSEIELRIKLLHGDTKSLINTHLKETFSETFYRTGYAMESGLQIQIGFGIIRDSVINNALKNPLLNVQWPGRLNKHHKTAIKNINYEITQGFLHGRGYSKTTSLIKEKVNISFGKAQRIVRTESHRLSSDAKELGFLKAESAADYLGIKTSRKLLSVLDKRTREQSEDMDGQIADDNGLFEYPDGTKATPGNTGNPAYDINDRESVIFIIDSMPPQYRRDALSKEVIPFTTYNEWFKNRIE